VFTTQAAVAICTVPASLIANSVTYSSATVSWGTTGAVSYYLRYKPTASSIWTTVSQTGTSRSLSGLTASTPYEFQVQSACSGGTSVYSSSSVFTTTAAPLACNVPTGLSTVSIAQTTATVGWSSTGAVSYYVRYKPTTSTSWITVFTSGTTSILSGLTAHTTYEFQVQSSCSGGASVYSGSSTFTTAKNGRGNIRL
jgi:hypothetical protein